MQVKIEIKRYTASGIYEPVAVDFITPEEAEMLTSFFTGKPPIEGFYQYVIPLPDGYAFVGHTINPDLLNYLKSTGANGTTPNSGESKEDQNKGV